jgi:hypothetical protein
LDRNFVVPKAYELPRISPNFRRVEFFRAFVKNSGFLGRSESIFGVPLEYPFGGEKEITRAGKEKYLM